jgi:hypothetical protein
VIHNGHRAFMMPVPLSATPTYFGMQALTLAGGTAAAAAANHSPALVYSTTAVGTSALTLRSPNAWLWGSSGNKKTEVNYSDRDSIGFTFRCRFSFGVQKPSRFFLGLKGVTGGLAIPAMPNTAVESTNEDIVGISMVSPFDNFKARAVCRGRTNGSFGPINQSIDLDLLDANGLVGSEFANSGLYDLTISSFPILDDPGALGIPPQRDHTYHVSLKVFYEGLGYEGAVIFSDNNAFRSGPGRDRQLGFTGLLSNNGVAAIHSLRIHGMSFEGFATAPTLPFIT